MKELSCLSLRQKNSKLELLDQTLIPHKQEWIDATQPKDMFEAILQLKVRGAPLIGVAAATCLGLLAESGASEEEFKKQAEYLRSSRPTAVNLMNAIDRLLQIEGGYNPKTIVQMAELIFDEDVELCEKMGANGAELIEDGDNILTHCNTGGLATVGIGTALAVIHKAHAQGKKIHVYVDETRPLLQGGRLTAWELEQLGVPYTLICDNMAASLMAQGKIQKIIVGSDRIALNGDFANKIGTYSVAVMAHYHRVKFYVAAPYTTVDQACLSGKDIPIEMRKDQEVKGAHFRFGNLSWAPEKAKVYNPAFDVTPNELVTAWVLDKGVFTAEDIKNNKLKN